MILSDKQIETYCTKGHPMIRPFTSQKISEVNGQKIISRGLSSSSYDISPEPHWKVFKNTNAVPIDPHKPNENYYEVIDNDELILPAHSFALCSSVEYFNIPRNIMGICQTKSTYARYGLFVNVTPLEPGWAGNLVIEVYNAAPLPIILRGGEGIAQIVFHECYEPKHDYTQRGGKYQNQRGITDGRV